MSRTYTVGIPARLAEIRVLTCNVQRPSVSRACRQAIWLAGSGADVLVLTEVSAGEPGDVLARLLRDEGFGVLLPGPSANDRYRVLVACRDTEPTGVDVGAGSMGHRCVAARVAFPAGEIGVMGLYVPSRGRKDRRNQDKRMFQERVAAMLPGVQKALDVSGPVVVAGDLNALEPDHDPRYAVFGDWEYGCHASSFTVFLPSVEGLRIGWPDRVRDEALDAGDGVVELVGGRAFAGALLG